MAIKIVSDEELKQAERDETEEMALLGNKPAAIRVVRALRKYRVAVQKVLGLRYSDGFIDGAAAAYFEDAVEEAEQELEGYEN